MEKQNLPNATAVLVLGILSILTCCLFGVFGLALAIIGLVLTHKDLLIYNQSPDKFINYQTLNVGKILCIIVLKEFSCKLIYEGCFVLTMGVINPHTC